MDVEIKEYNSMGYKPLVDYSSWRVAILNYNKHSTLKGISYIERHLETDEVFVLLKGRAILATAGGGKRPCGKFKNFKMKPGKIFNVKKAIWHTAFMSKNAKILIVENRNTVKSNSRYCYFDGKQKEQLKKIWMQM